MIVMRRDDPALNRHWRTALQSWRSSSEQDLCPIVHLSTRRGLVSFKTPGGSYNSFHVSGQQICRNHAVGMHTVGVKVNADDTEIYVSP